MIVAAPARLPVRLEASCGQPGCAEFAANLLRVLRDPSYSRSASVMQLPARFSHWQADHRTARKRASRCERLGYRFDAIDRSAWADDIHAINTSLRERQGRPMAAGYLERQEYDPLPNYPCERHRISTFGIIGAGRLRAYLVLYRSGELALISQILGHGDHLAANVMYLLAAGTVAAEVPLGGLLYYNRHDSGTAGLRFYKERIGFRPADLELVL